MLPGPGGGVAASPEGGQAARHQAQGAAGGVEPWGAGGVAGPHAHTATLVGPLRVQGPRAAPGHDQGQRPVVVVKLRPVCVRVLLVTVEMLAEVDVDRVVVHIIRGPRVPQAGGHVPESSRSVEAEAGAVAVPVACSRAGNVILLLGVQDPDTSEAAALDPVVHGTEPGQVVGGHQLLPSLARQVVTHQPLVLSGGLGEGSRVRGGSGGLLGEGHQGEEKERLHLAQLLNTK